LDVVLAGSNVPAGTTIYVTMMVTSRNSLALNWTMFGVLLDGAAMPDKVPYTYAPETATNSWLTTILTCKVTVVAATAVTVRPAFKKLGGESGTVTAIWGEDASGQLPFFMEVWEAVA
jgi:hypothetical protein